MPGVRLGMQINLEPSALKLLIKLLDMAGDEFSNHGCNDFHLLRDGGLTAGEAEELKSRLQAEFSGEEAAAFDHDMQSDWFLYAGFQKIFEKALVAAESSH